MTSVTGPGARPWRVPAITAIRLGTGIGFALVFAASASPLAADAMDPVGRVYGAAAAYGGLEDGLSESEVRRGCGVDALCAARRIAAASGGRGYLERVTRPDSDSIRWARSQASVTTVRRLADGRGLVALDRFGRKASGELRAALAALRKAGEELHLVLDLRGNGGGDLGRMMRTAALFTGDTKDAIYLVGKTAKKSLDLELEGSVETLAGLTVLVGPGTASSGEILAALLYRHAAADLVGQRTAGKDTLTRVVPVDHDWRLLLPAERVEVPGVDLRGGLVPRPLSADERIAWIAQ